MGLRLILPEMIFSLNMSGRYSIFIAGLLRMLEVLFWTPLDFILQYLKFLRLFLMLARDWRGSGAKRSKPHALLMILTLFEVSPE